MTTQITSMAVENSTVDNTPIGSTGPSSGIFSTLNLSTGAPDGQILTGNGSSFVAAPAVPAGSGSLATPGYFVFSGGLILQWGTTGLISNDTPSVISFLTAFPNACLCVVCIDEFFGGHSAIWSAYGFTTTDFTIRPDTNNGAANWLAVGW